MEELQDTVLDHEPASIEDKYFEAYFGLQSSYYLQKYTLYKSGQTVMFNIAPFFVGFFWLLYRKMYLYAIVSFGVITASDYGEAYLFEYLSIDYDLQRLISLGITIGFAVLFSLFGNYFYLQKAELEVRGVLSSTPDEDTRMELLTRKGGTSWIPILLVMGLMVGTFVIDILHLW